jgi:hypothetical protein
MVYSGAPYRKGARQGVLIPPRRPFGQRKLRDDCETQLEWIIVANKIEVEKWPVKQGGAPRQVQACQPASKVISAEHSWFSIPYSQFLILNFPAA